MNIFERAWRGLKRMFTVPEKDRPAVHAAADAIADAAAKAARDRLAAAIKERLEREAKRLTEAARKGKP